MFSIFFETRKDINSKIDGGGGGLRAQSNVLVKIEEVDYAMSILMPRVLWMNCFPCSSSIHGRSALVPFY